MTKSNSNSTTITTTTTNTTITTTNTTTTQQFRLFDGLAVVAECGLGLDAEDGAQQLDHAGAAYAPCRAASAPLSTPSPGDVSW
eukprot:15115324-Heterocapsa_arctica.AAC.1